MSSDPVELVQGFTRAWNENGVAGIAPFLHPDVEWVDPPELPGAGTHHGRDDTMAFLREWEGSLGIVRLHFEVDEIIGCPVGFLSVTTASGKGDGGAPISPHQWFHWITVDPEGKMLRAQLFLDREAALQASGASE